MAGYFFMDKSKYNKPALSSDEIVRLIKSKNLQIHDHALAILHLKTVSYHRLSAYFECLLINDALECIEIAFRTSLSDTMSCLHSPHWFLNASLFKNNEKYQVFLTQVNAACSSSHELQIVKCYQ